MFEKIKNFFQKPFRAILFILTVLIIAGYGYLTTRPDKSLYNYATVQRSDILQEVSVTGRVKPAQAVDLAFQLGGKIARVNANVGDKAAAGQILAVLENNDLNAQLAQAKANLATQQAKHNELQAGARPEEVQIAKTNVLNAQKVLADSRNNLINVENKAQVDLDNLYDDIKNILNDAYIDADDAVNAQIDDLFINDNSASPQLTFHTGSQSGSDSEWKRRLAEIELAKFKEETINPPSNNIGRDAAMTNASGHLNIILDFLNTLSLAVDESSGLTSATTATYKSAVNTARTNVSAALSAISDKKQAIAAQEAANQSNIATAEAAVNTNENSLRAYQDQLALKQAGNAPEQINAQAAQVLHAQAAVSSSLAQLAKSVIVSPINGVITKQDAKIGEIAGQNAVLISIISAARFEIEANVAEVDIAKIKLGNEANITLDAYGSGTVFKGTAVKIDPAETIIEGVATYKTTFQFSLEDERIKSGMTANIDIQADRRQNVLVVPQRAVATRNGEQYVLMDADREQPEQKIIVTGLRGSDGNWEIISGLKEGDRIVSTAVLQ